MSFTLPEFEWSNKKAEPKLRSVLSQIMSRLTYDL